MIFSLIAAFSLLLAHATRHSFLQSHASLQVFYYSLLSTTRQFSHNIMAKSFEVASIHRSLAVAFLLFNLVAFLSSSISSTTVLTAEALPRPRIDGKGLSSSAPAGSVFRNPFLNQNVELTGNDGNHHDLVQAIMGSTSSTPSKSLTIVRRKAKRQLSGGPKASILNGNSRGPVLMIDHSLYPHQLEVEGEPGQEEIGTRLRKRGVTLPPGGPGSGGYFNKDQPQSRRLQDRSA